MKEKLASVIEKSRDAHSAHHGRRSRLNMSSVAEATIPLLDNSDVLLLSTLIHTVHDMSR